MGIWEFIGSTAEAVKRNSPDAMPLKNACRNSYSYGSAACRTSYAYGSAACTKIDRAVRVNGLHRLGQWMPDDETKSKIGIYTSKFAKNAGLYALQEGYKLIPGGVAFSKILSQTLNDVRYENRKVEKLKVPEEKVGIGKLTAGADMHGKGGVEAIDRSPKDEIRIFMMKEFFGTRFLDGLMVQESARGKGKKPE